MSLPDLITNFELGVSATNALASLAALFAASLFGIPSFTVRGPTLAPAMSLVLLAIIQPSMGGVVLLAFVFVGATVLAWLAMQRSIKRDAATLEVISGLSLYGLWSIWSSVAGGLLLSTRTYAPLLFLIGIGGSWVLVDAVIRVTTGRPTVLRDACLRWSVLDVLIALMAVGSAAVSSVIWITVGPWAAAVTAIPYWVTHSLLTNFIRSRNIEGAAIRALGRLPEAAGLAAADHSASVERLCRALGLSTGLRGRALDHLLRAALLHDVGLVCTAQTDVREFGFSSGDIARWGSDILGSAPTLAHPASIIRAQADPFRAPGSIPDPAVDLRSQIVQVACEIDRMRASGMSVREVVDALYLETSFRFAPELMTKVAAAMESADEQVLR